MVLSQPKIYHSVSAIADVDSYLFLRQSAKPSTCFPLHNRSSIQWFNTARFVVVFALQKYQKYYKKKIILFHIVNITQSKTIGGSNSVRIRFHCCLRKRKPHLKGFQIFHNGIVQQPQAIKDDNTCKRVLEGLSRTKCELKVSKQHDKRSCPATLPTQTELLPALLNVPCCFRIHIQCKPNPVLQVLFFTG